MAEQAAGCQGNFDLCVVQRTVTLLAKVYPLRMNRRRDNDTAEKVRLAFLTKAAFGLDAGVHVAMHYGLSPALVGSILSRRKSELRDDLHEVLTEVEHRRGRP